MKTERPPICAWHPDGKGCEHHGYMCRNRPVKATLFARIVHRVLWVLGRRGNRGGL